MARFAVMCVSLILIISPFTLAQEDGGVYRIKSVLTSKVLAPDDEGTLLVQKSNKAKSDDQHWKLVKSNSKDGNNFSIVNVKTGKALTSPNKEALAQIALQDFDGKPKTGQVWSFELRDDRYTIRSRFSGFYLDVFNFEKKDGVKIIQQTLSGKGGSDNQLWELIPVAKLNNPKPVVGTQTLAKAQTKMEELASTTKKGLFYPNDKVEVPEDLDGFRAQMLAYGNAGRRDPNFRKNNGSKTATDLSGATVETMGKGEEKVYKNNPNPPYFNNLKMNDKLNEAAQFQAEYQAKIQQVTHDGPANYKGTDLSGFGKRVEHFCSNLRVVGEGAAAGKVGTYPHGWMASDTHFRPWFNVGNDFREVGVGAAKGANGKWYFCFVAGLGAK